MSDDRIWEVSDYESRIATLERELAEAASENEAMRSAGLAQAIQLEAVKDRLAEADAIIRADGEGDLEQYSELKARMAERERELKEAREALGSLAEKYNALIDKEDEYIENQALADEEVSPIHEVGRNMQARAEAAEARLAAGLKRLNGEWHVAGIDAFIRDIRAALTAPAEPPCECWPGRDCSHRTGAAPAAAKEVP